MAHASRKHFGPGSQGKGDGTGAMTDIEPEAIPDNIVLSNRDKAQHSDQRGLDGRAMQTEQFQDHAANRMGEPNDEDELGDEDADLEELDESDIDADLDDEDADLDGTATLDADPLKVSA